jgi:sialate O-acetylesterase
MIVTTDLVDSLQDLHPAYKWEIGRRLALYALAKDYGKGLVYSGPWYKTMVVKGDKIEVSFSDTGGGLVSKDGRPLNWFSIAGRDHNFVPASAVIEGKNKLLVSAKGVGSPDAIRFGWNEGAQPNLFNKEGLPAMPFRVILHSK